MRLEHWLLAVSAGLVSLVAFSCAADQTYQTNKEDGDDDDDESTTIRDAGRDASTRDARAPTPTTSQDRETTTTDTVTANEDSNVCDQVSIQARPNAPDVLIVLDRSSSMVGPGNQNRWNPSVQAVKTLTQELNDAIRFGLMLFPAPGAQAGIAQGILDGLGLGVINTFLPEDTGCAEGKVVVPIKQDSAASIAQALDRGAPQGVAYTPTATSLDAARKALSQGACADCASTPTYVVLVTDGQPTCTSGQPPGTQADVDATNAAIDRLREAEIKTFVVGYGTASDPMASAAMASFAEHGGTEKYLAVENGEQLVRELRTIAGSLVSCEYELNEDVADPALVRVIIDGNELVLNEGWRLDGRMVILEGACDRIKDAKVHNVSIKKDCEPRSFQ